MRIPCRLALALSTSLICSSASASALDTLRNCAARVAPDTQGLAALNAECPELNAALSELALADKLPKGWQDSLNRDGLVDLEALARRYQRAPPAAALNRNALPNILQDLAREQPPSSKSWWEAVKEWLRSWFEKNQDEAASSWLEQLLQRLKPAELTLRVLLFGLLALAVIAAIAVVINELRAAGLLKRSKPVHIGSPQITMAQADADGVASLGDLDAAALHDKPAILLRLLVARLLVARRLKAERSLTHRELSQRGQFASPQQHACFAQVAHLAEQLLYGPAPSSPEHIEQVIAAGRTLLQQLESVGSVP